MKLPAFNHHSKKWDLYKQFHVPYCGGALVQFESGEFIVRSPRYKPYLRKTYDNFAIRIALSRDEGLPAMKDPDGNDIPVTWLNYNGGQTLFMDLDRKRVYALNRMAHKNVPSYANPSALYFANADADPIGGMIALAKPDDKFRQENKAWLNELRAACKALSRIKSLQSRYETMSKSKYHVPTRLVGVPVEQVLDTMHDIDVFRIAEHGFAYDRAVTEVPYLTIS